jgi:hypothetical protein
MKVSPLPILKPKQKVKSASIAVEMGGIQGLVDDYHL